MTQSRLPKFQYFTDENGVLWRAPIKNGHADTSQREQVKESPQAVTKMLKHNRRKRLVP